MEEDILNYSPTVMFRGTPCILFFSFLTEEQRKKEGLNLEIQTPMKSFINVYCLRPGRPFQNPCIVQPFCIFVYNCIPADFDAATNKFEFMINVWTNL